MIPLVTVITATYNAESLLPATILSIRKLNYPNIEWIIVDGNSSDATVSLLQKNQDIIKYWITEPDQGIYDAWNKGIAKASGEWITFLGAGDKYHPNAISKYIDAINNSDTPIQFASSRARFIDDYGNYRKIVGKKYNWLNFKRQMDIAHVGALHHKTLFENYGLFDTNFKAAGDYEFFFRFGNSLKAIYIKDITVDIILGGVSNGYGALYETYRIQRQYGSVFGSRIRYIFALSKRFFHSVFRGY